MNPELQVEENDQVDDEHEDYSELRNAVEAAYEQEESGGSDEDPTQQARAEGPEDEEQPRAGRQRDANGRFARQSPDEVPIQPESALEAELARAAEGGEVTDARAPQSWRADAREHWNRLPPQVQAEVMRREHETSNVLNQTAEERKIAHAFREAVSPFEAMVRAEGSDPLRATAALFKTAYQLRQGSPQSKAQLVAEMVEQYGIDLDMLDRSLAARMSGQPQAPQQQQYEKATMQDPRLDQLLTGLQQIHQQQTYAEAQEANAMVGDFAQTHEFFADVREEMADMIEMAQRRGMEMSMEDAYNRAVHFNPATAAVMAQRGTPQQSVARARNAASSVRSQPSGTSAASREPTTLRGAIEAAMEGSQ